MGALLVQPANIRAKKQQQGQQGEGQQPLTPAVGGQPKRTDRKNQYGQLNHADQLAAEAFGQVMCHPGKVTAGSQKAIAHQADQHDPGRGQFVQPQRQAKQQDEGRFLLATNPVLIARVLGIVYRVIAGHLIRQGGYKQQSARPTATDPDSSGYANRRRPS